MRRVWRARSEEYGIRRFSIPALNFQAKAYFDIIDWQNTIVSEPPLPKENTTYDMEMLVACHETPMIDLPKFPCHTQAVERCVKLVTDSSMAVRGAVLRDGFIRMRLKS